MNKKNNKKNSLNLLKNDLCYEGEVEEIGLCSANNLPEGTPVSSFNFSEEPLEDNRKTKKAANTATLPIDNEPYSISRFYKLRYSTAKMLNEIKANHPDVNVYMNTIVDEAIRYYYSYTFEKDNTN